MAINPGDVVTGLGGRYRVESRHGEGSFGITYRAVDDAGGHVILKELRIEKLDDWKALELFEREGRVLSSVSHANIPAFRDFFAHGAPSALPVTAMSSYTGPERLSLVLVQQFVEGVTLQARVDKGWELRPDDAEVILRSLLHALQYLHERDPPLVHRDIKPGNVILAPEGEPYLVDFGAIQDRLRSGGSIGSTIVGTLGYMPLEQIRGDARPASDLYALGVTMVVAISGRQLSDLTFDDSTGRVALEGALPAGISAGLRAALEAMVAPLLGQRAHSASDVLAKLDALAVQPRVTPVPEPVDTPRVQTSEQRKESRKGRKERHRAPFDAGLRPPGEPAPAPERPRFDISPNTDLSVSDTDDWENPKSGVSPPVIIMTVAAALVFLVFLGAGMSSSSKKRRSTTTPVATATSTAIPTPPARPGDALAPGPLPAGSWTGDQITGCRSSKADSCLTLASIYEQAKDWPRAMDAFRLACELSNGKGCTRLAANTAAGLGVPKDPVQAVALFLRGCDFGDAGGCGEYGRHLAWGIDVPADVPKGRSYVERACTGGDASGCGFLGYMYRDGKGVKPDLERAAGLIAQACNGDYKTACVDLGDLYAAGRGVTRDRPRAISFYQTACAAKIQAGCDAATKLNMGSPASSAHSR